MPQLVKKVFLTSWWTGEQAPPPLPPLPVFAEIFQISGRKNCKVTIFALENEIFRHKNRPAPAVHAAGLDSNSRGLRPSRALRGFFDSLRHDCAEARSCLFLTGNEWGYSAGMSRIRAIGVPASVKFSVKVAVSSFTVKSSGDSTLSSSSRARVEPVSTSAGSEI